MTIALSEQALQELYQESVQHQSAPENCDQAEVTKLCPSQLGRGYMRWIQLRDIGLLIHNYQLQDDAIDSGTESSEGCLEFGFRMSGNCTRRSAGQNFLLDGPRKLGISQLLKGEHLLQVDIHLNSLEMLSSFMPGASIRSPATEQLFENAGERPYHQIGSTTLAMQLALNQLLNCPYQGLTKQIYLESKCYELVALKLDQLAEIDKEEQATRLFRLEHDDVERIHQAKDILITHLDNPPSLLELARQVGINDHKLKKGFRQVFGTTAFGYLLHYRLEQARQLLATGEMNVAEVANKVGFANRSYFTKAFCKRYGQTPGAYRRSQRGTFYTS